MTNEPVCKGLRSKNKVLLLVSEKLDIPVEQVRFSNFILIVFSIGFISMECK